jgi:microcystin-dependent protein
MDIKDLILIVFGLLIVYLFYKTRNLEKLENFESSDILINAINTRYNADIDALRNLASLAKNILNNNDTLTLPATNTTGKNLILEGNITITNKNTCVLEIFPKFMVVAWANNIIPKGWAICDGRKYILDTSPGINFGTAISNDGSYGIQTPDLRGRFILGSGVGGKDMNNNNLIQRNLNDTGGEEKHVLTINEMAKHKHAYVDRMLPTPNDDTAGQAPIFTNLGLTAVDTAPPNGWGAGIWQAWASSNPKPIYGKNDNTAETGNSEAHNIMPPFYVLTYIMKL